MTKPDWLPDWRDASQYPNHKEFPGGSYYNIWGWEFLRRNEEYQKFWHELYEIYCQNLKANNTLNEVPIESRITATESKKMLEYTRLHGDQSPRMQLTEKFGITRNGTHPRFNAVSIKFNNAIGYNWSASAHSSLPELALNDPVPSLNNNNLIIAFDIHGDMKQQITWAKALLQKAKDNHPHTKHWVSKKTRHENLTDMLRILDAKAVGATHREIAAVLYPKLNHSHPEGSGLIRVRDTNIAAKRIKNHNYKFIL